MAQTQLYNAGYDLMPRNIRQLTELELVRYNVCELYRRCGDVNFAVHAHMIGTLTDDLPALNIYLNRELEALDAACDRQAEREMRCGL